MTSGFGLRASGLKPEAEKPGDNTMPKLKTHEASPSASRRPQAERFLRSKAFKQHILTSKSSKRKRRMRGTTEVAKADAKKLAKLLPYK